MAPARPVSSRGIQTRLLIISDTHGLQLPVEIKTPVDVAVHCGDLTQHSKLDEFRAAIQLIESINAPLKIIIAGNHDFSLDIPVFKRKISEAVNFASEPIDDALIKKEYGDYGTARNLLLQLREKSIVFLEEGTHQFNLRNGARLTIYASPYTPTTISSSDWGFQYNDDHTFSITKAIDIAITHGPPHGILDLSEDKKRVGCPQLFAAIAKAQPRIHCFGHAHEGWGAKLVAWRSVISDAPSHFTDIDNNESQVIENMASLRGSKFDSPEERKAREERLAAYRERGYCEVSHLSDQSPLGASGKTLFINAAVMGQEGLDQLPWVVDIELPGFA
ncbi:Metallo-dependent phosphatase [Trichoderma citrinoviride]|uniref:Metallo-dependent phosphatase n=1 Tax=Trichoderma citrinoviride TaxID=58853 RepID=A0A2T4AXD0_9HYPO|nr:Metallo-dependent phosphatase [Trichoderma citrinoviride]PTB61744.1 Metallo-dependent phosphatase [Trichoderma citrinoviride]